MCSGNCQKVASAEHSSSVGGSVEDVVLAPRPEGRVGSWAQGLEVGRWGAVRLAEHSACVSKSIWPRVKCSAAGRALMTRLQFPLAFGGPGVSGCQVAPL